MRVTDTDAASYVVSAVLANAEEEKNASTCLLLSYAMPFLLLLHSVVSVDGALGHENLMLVQHIADRLSGGWSKVSVMCYIT